MKKITIKREWKFASALVPYWVVSQYTPQDFIDGKLEGYRYDAVGTLIRNGKTIELELDDDIKSIFACSATGMLSNELSLEDIVDEKTPIILTTKGGFSVPSYPHFVPISK